LFVNQTSQTGAEKVGISFDRSSSWGLAIKNTSSSAPVYLNAHKQTPGNDNQIKFAAGQYLVSCSDACEKVLVDASFTVCSCEETGGCSTTSGIDSACPIVQSWSGPVSCP
jgi:hypothetical protein